MVRPAPVKLFLVGLIFGIIAIGSTLIAAAATPTYYGYWNSEILFPITILLTKAFLPILLSAGPANFRCL